MQAFKQKMQAHHHTTPLPTTVFSGAPVPAHSVLSLTNLYHPVTTFVVALDHDHNLLVRNYLFLVLPTCMVGLYFANRPTHSCRSYRGCRRNQLGQDVS